MRRVGMALLVCAALLLTASAALAQTLPGIDCFSPGLVRVSDALNAGAAVSVKAQISADNAFYARDISVLRALLLGTTFSYDGSANADRLRIAHGGETMLDAALTRGEPALLTLDGETYALEDGALPLSAVEGAAQSDALLGAILSWPVFERVPLASIADGLEALKVGDTLLGCLTVTRAFTVKRTMSDDGTRLTRIDVNGALAPADFQPYEVTGFLRQPGGKAPKDTFEITAKRDDNNFFTLSYSSTRSSEITRRDEAGTATVQTTLRSDGKLDGSRIDSRLTVRLTNAWTADGDSLSEKIAVTAHLGHTDRTPGRQMQRLNDISADLRVTLGIATDESEYGAYAFTNDATLSIDLDGNAFLGGKMQGSVSVRQGVSDAKTAQSEQATPLDGEGLRALLDETARGLAARLYPTLGDDSRAKVESGL